MGERAERKRRFLSKHPTCCFCGGRRPATEEDHIPPRSFFLNREWPEGFSFPACHQCNSSTRLDEQLVALLSRIYPDAASGQEERELRNLAEGIERALPGALAELDPTPEQIQEARARHDLPDDHPPLLNVRGPLINRAVHRFGYKLICALYYLHSERILPAAGGVLVRWFTNVQMFTGDLPPDLYKVAAAHGVVLRNSRTLTEQFAYRFGATENWTMAAFAAKFRESFLVFGVALTDAEAVEPPEHGALLRPRTF